MNTTRPAPTVLGACDPTGGSAGVAAQYREVLAQGSAVLQGCSHCAAASFPPRLRCRSCAGDELQWWHAGGAARVTSWARVALTGSTETASVPRRVGGEGPYTTVVVEPEGFTDVRILCVLVTADGEIEHDAVPSPGGRVMLRAAAVGGTPVPVCSLDTSGGTP